MAWIIWHRASNGEIADLLSATPRTCRLQRRLWSLPCLPATSADGICSSAPFPGRPAGIASPRRYGTGTGCAACRSLRSWSVIPCCGQSLLAFYRLFRAVGREELGAGNRLYQGIYGGDGWLTYKDVRAMEGVLTDPEEGCLFGEPTEGCGIWRSVLFTSRWLCGAEPRVR